MPIDELFLELQAVANQLIDRVNLDCPDAGPWEEAFRDALACPDETAIAAAHAALENAYSNEPF